MFRVTVACVVRSGNRTSGVSGVQEAEEEDGLPGAKRAVECHGSSTFAAFA